MGYYGLSLNSGSLGGNLYVNFMLGGLVEFPGYTVCFLCFKLGRKALHVFGMMVGGLACLGTVMVDQFAKGKLTFFGKGTGGSSYHLPLTDCLFAFD